MKSPGKSVQEEGRILRAQVVLDMTMSLDGFVTAPRDSNLGLAGVVKTSPRSGEDLAAVRVDGLAGHGR
jgi:hypothetical protein